MNAIKTKYSEAAVQSLIEASREARSGNMKAADSHFQKADSAMKEHVNYLKSLGNHKEADYSKKMYEAQKRVMMEAHQFNVKSVKRKTKKSEADQINEIGKGIFLKAENISTKMKLGQSKNPRYQYKGFHELHPEDRQRILGMSGNPSMYPGMDHHKYVYPTDQSGRLVHSQRVMAPEGHDVAAAHAAMQESAPKGSKFTEGQGIRVDSPGHELHGKLGIVQMPHPSYPNKISVLFSGGRKELLDQSAIKPSSMSKVDVAKSTIIDIRSRLKNKKRQ